MSNKIERLKQAAELRDQRYYTEARQIYLQLLRDFDPEPSIMWGLAQIEFALGIISPDAEDTYGFSAIQWMERAIALNSSCPDYYYSLGTMLAQAEVPNYQAAAQAYRRAIEIEPFYAPALSNLAALYGVPEGVVSLEEAIAYSERTVRVNPTRSTWAMLARLYDYAGRPVDNELALLNSFLERYDPVPIRY